MLGVEVDVLLVDVDVREQLGAAARSHQFASPSSSIVAGTSATRTIDVDRDGDRQPRPISFSARGRTRRSCRTRTP